MTAQCAVTKAGERAARADRRERRRGGGGGHRAAVSPRRGGEKRNLSVRVLLYKILTVRLKPLTISKI